MNETSSPNQEHQSQNPITAYSKNPMEWCQKLINLGLSGRHGDPAKMVAIIGQGAILGLDPYTSLQCLYQVGNQVHLMTNMMHALVERSGLLEDKRHVYTGEKDSRSCTVWVKRLNRTEQKYSFSVAEAKAADIYKPGGSWSKYLDSMLYARAMGFALEREFPDILKGMHSYEEMHVEPEPAPLKVVEPQSPSPEPEQKPEQKPEEEEIKKPRRKRRTKAEMLAAKANDSLPPASKEQQEDVVDIDKAIPKEVTPLEELLYRSSNSNVSEEEVLAAAKALRLSFDETNLSDMPQDKLKTMLHHWPSVLGMISREKAKAARTESVGLE